MSAKKKLSARDRFDMRGFAVIKYARAYKLNASMLSRVLSGELKGVRDKESGIRRIIAQLKKDGVLDGERITEYGKLRAES